MFQRSPTNFFTRPRAQNRNRDRDHEHKTRLTKLYSDTKQSYEVATRTKVVPSPSPAAVMSRTFMTTGDIKDDNLHYTTSNDDADGNAELLELRKDFRLQQDRLLAWGVFWADVGANQSQSQSQSQTQLPSRSPLHQTGDFKTRMDSEVEIDRKIDQAGLGDLVAGVMEEIKRLLDESGRLSHPGRWEEHQQQLQRTSPKLTMMKSWGASGAAADNEKAELERKEKENEWRDYEVKTGRILLEQLTGCIDVLYSLVDQDGKKVAQEKSDGFVRDANISVTDAEGQPDSASMADVCAHPLYIDFARLQAMHDPERDDEEAAPPSYDDVQNASGLQARSIYFYGDAQAHVIVDLVATKSLPAVAGSENPIQRFHQLAEQLCGGGLLSWDGHLKMLGFTLAGSKMNLRFGIVYALPAPRDPTALQQHQTLSATVAASYDHDTSMPPLENKFRLAYNIALVVTGFLAHNATHGHIRSSNIIFLREHESSQHGELGATIRCPYLLQPLQALVGLVNADEPLQEVIYRHPDADEAGYGAVAAHDIYSVGLVLLEIGMWLPLRKFWKPKYYSDRHIFAERMRKTYSPKLASKCGSRYMKAVQKCLDAPTELNDKPMNIDAAEYLLDIVKELAHCCALDETDQPSNLDLEVFEAMIEEAQQSLPMQVEELAKKMKFKDKALPAIPVELPAESGPGFDSQQKVRKGRSMKPSDERPTLRKFPDLPIPQAHLTAWNSNLMPKLQRILSKTLVDTRESASVSLMMIGPNPEKAVTTIVVQCAESHTAKVHEELKQSLKCKMRLGRGWGLVVLKGDIRRSARRGIQEKPKNSEQRAEVYRSIGDSAKEPEGPKPKQREYQKRPACGASIGAFKDGEHLPPVTFGGTVLVDGKPFGMSVHHMLDDVSERGSNAGDDSDSDDEAQHNNRVPDTDEPHRSSMTRTAVKAELEAMGSHIQLHTDIPNADELDLSEDDMDDGDYMYESESDTSTIRPDYSTFDEEGNEFWFADDSSSLPDLDYDDDESLSGSEGEELASVGDRPGFDRFAITADEDDELCITQPALDDVDDDFFPSIEDRDDDHLSSHSLGFVHASSGIRRTIKDNVKHEIDWALIDVEEPRCGYSAIKNARSSKSRSRTTKSGNLLTPYLIGVSPVETLPNMSVSSVGRTSGPAAGRISQAMSLVKFHGRTSFSASFTVEGGFGVPGDSGAWVWNEERKELCGHVLAWADGLKVAFMAPAEVTFNDIRDQLGVQNVELPGSALQRSSITSVKNSNSSITDTDTAMGSNAYQPRKQQTTKGKEIAKVSMDLPERSLVNEQLERARELEVALQNMKLDPMGGGSITTGISSSQQNTRRSNTNTNTNSRVSSVSSTQSTTRHNDDQGGGCIPRKERFDTSYLLPGGSTAGVGIGGGPTRKDTTLDVNVSKALPMARALS